MADRREGQIMDTGSGIDIHFMRMVWPVALLVLLVGAPAQYARAQSPSTANNESNVTFYGGGRFGGSVTDSTTNSTIDLKNGSSFGVAVDIGLDRSRQLELFYSQQDTALTPGAFSLPTNNSGLTLRNYHLGGTAFIDEVGRGPYVMGGIGATMATPKSSGLNSSTFFSGNLGLGWMLPVGAHVAFRFEARGYGVLLNNNSALFCGGASGCRFAIKSNGLFYGEALAGLSIRF
jgi:outer membrane protein with beta-barrel domain